MTRLLRGLALSCVALTVIVAAPPSSQKLEAAGSQACSAPTRRVTLYASEMPRVTPEEDPVNTIRIGYGLTPDNPTIPGPTLEMMEGECMAITLHNLVSPATLAELRDNPVVGSRDPSMPLGVSLHTHGVRYTPDSDGTLHTGSIVPPGQSRTYYWYAEPKIAEGKRILSQGTAGYWWYHDHIAGTDHGTGGLYSGLFGGMIVRRPGDLKPDRPTFVVAMGPNQTINLKRWTNDPANRPTVFEAVQGERVEFLVIGFGDEFHTFHLHAHNWADNRTGILTSPLDETRIIDNKTVGPADTFGFQINAGETSGPGEWMLHCHVQLHSDVGMFTFLDVKPAETPTLELPINPSVSSPIDHVHYGRELGAK